MNKNSLSAFNLPSPSTDYGERIAWVLEHYYFGVKMYGCEFYPCRECGSLVLVDHLETHVTWHKKQKAV
jgi:hypothetical protein